MFPIGAIERECYCYQDRHERECLSIDATTIMVKLCSPPYPLVGLVGASVLIVFLALRFRSYERSNEEDEYNKGSWLLLSLLLVAILSIVGLLAYVFLHIGICLTPVV